MLNLAEYRRKADRLADHLPWAALVAPGVVLNKDGSFQRTLAFRGPDLESATEAELVSVCARANNVLKRFGTGWALHFEAERREALGYPASTFPEPASWLVDEERRAGFENAGQHFESRYHLTLTYMPPADQAGSHLDGWIDLFHATPAIGQLMLDRLNGPGSYGERLTPESVDARVEKVRAQLEDYATRYPEDLAFLKKSLAKFQSPPLK